MSEVLPEDSFEAAAAEAAAIGPQLCVILSLADATQISVVGVLLGGGTSKVNQNSQSEALGSSHAQNSELSVFMLVHVWSPVLLKV